MEIKKKIIESLFRVTGLKAKDIHLETPEREEHGDYSSNIAMQMFSQDKGQRTKGKDKKNKQVLLTGQKSPRELAKEIIEELRQDKKLQRIVERIEVAGPGFINFHLTRIVLVNELEDIISTGDEYGKTNTLKNKKISVEYTDPNPFKEFHIGHLISNLTGESLCKIFEANGATVWRADYFGNVGMHIAKSVWGMMKKMKEDNLTLEELESKSIEERQEFMGNGYAFGSRKYDESDEIKERVKDINYMIYIAAQEIYKDKGWKPRIDYKKYVYGSMENYERVKKVYAAGLSWSLEYFETIYKRLGTKFDGYYPESVVGELGYELVKKNLGKIFQESEGAVIFEGEKYGLHTRVFVNKLGLPTYEAKELGLAPMKYKDFAYDKSINVVGKEIREYFSVLVEALKQVHPKLGKVTEPICTGMVSVPSGKMGSRFGNVVTVNSLLGQLKDIINNNYLKDDYPKDEKDKISEEVAKGALKYAFLKNRIGTDFVFDINESVSLEGNSGPYIQYTYARTRSVLRKSQKSKVKIQNMDFSKLELNKEELSLLRTFIKFSETVASAAENYAPNLICNYLYDLSQKFNTFYQKHDILKERIKDEDLSRFRLALTFAMGQILKSGLNLLGVQVPERM